MNRVATAIIAVCMVLIAGAFGAVLYRVAGLSIGEAVAVALGMLLIFVLLENHKLRERDRLLLEGKIEDLNRFSGTLARETQHLEERVAVIETGAEHPTDKRIETVATDLAKVDVRLARLTDIVAEMEEEMHAAPAQAPQVAAPAQIAAAAVKPEPVSEPPSPP
ncbi:MAG: hypothetical protein KDJ16_17280, partial [Hyphomicrobiales bacterium]|nr:hypothetical protein [Hyphomicrobiales bacterium]